MMVMQLPAEVKAGETKAQRSKTTGHLVLTMPKVRLPFRIAQSCNKVP